jgi:HK97 family phage prohead protease
MLFQHDPNQPIGVWLDVREDAHGLYVKGRLTLDVARAREVLALMRAGALDGLSIGYRTVRGRTDAGTGVRRLMEVDLWEISVVTFPMLPDARVSAVKTAPTAAALRWAARRMRQAVPPLRAAASGAGDRDSGGGGAGRVATHDPPPPPLRGPPPP